MSKQKVKKQHIVPCRFLANFSENPALKRKAVIWTYNKNTKQYKKASVESVFYENDIYSISMDNIKADALEQTFAGVESLCIPYIDRFIQRGGFSFDNLGNNIPLEAENAFVQQFIVSLLMRHPKYVKQALLLEKERYNGEFKGFLYAINFKRNFDRNLDLINQNRDLHSYKASAENFILSDHYSTAIGFQKMQECFPLPQEVEKQALKDGVSLSLISKFWNELIDISVQYKSATYGSAIIFCPVSPKIAIGLVHKTLSKNSRKNYKKSNFIMSQRPYSEKGVRMINQKTFQQAANFIYAKDRETLEETVDLADVKFES